MKKLGLAALAFFFAWTAAALGQTSTPVGATWTLIGAGPLTLQAPGTTPEQVIYAISDAEPAAGAAGKPIPASIAIEVLTTSEVWAVAPGADAPVAVLSAPVPAIFAAPYDALLAADGGKAVHVTNWPSDLGGGGAVTLSGALPDTAAGDLAAIHANTAGLATAAKQPTLNGDGGAPAHVTNFPAATPDTAAGDLAAIHANTAGLATAAKQPTLNGDGGAPAHVTNFPTTTPDTAAGDLAAIHANTAGLATAANQPTLNGDGGAPAHVTNFPATTPDTAAGDLAAIHANTAGLATAANQKVTNAGTSATAAQAVQGVTGGVPLPVVQSSQYPNGATPVQGSATGTTAATAATLAAASSVTNYVCEISIRANATAAATGNATLSDGTKTFNFTQWTAPNASGVGVVEEIFAPCYPASAVNTAWTLTSAAPGTGGVVSVAIAGYQK